MSVTIDVSDLQAHLDEYLERAKRERILVRYEDGSLVPLGPGEAPAASRRRHRSPRTVAEVLAEDRGA